MSTADFVRLIRKRAKEDLETMSEYPHKIGIKVERGVSLGAHKVRGSWIDVQLFLPDETCDHCDKPITPGEEIEKHAGERVFCKECRR